MDEHKCDKCGTNVPNGYGYYRGDDRMCYECYNAKVFILIDMITGTVMNYDDKVVMVNVAHLSEYGQMLYDEWNETGADATIMALGHVAGTPIPYGQLRNN